MERSREKKADGEALRTKALGVLALGERAPFLQKRKAVAIRDRPRRRRQNVSHNAAKSGSW
jgi:hypothetical protein